MNVEEEIEELDRMNFSEALEDLKAGTRVMREGWNAIHYIRIQRPDENSMITGEYIVIHTASGQIMPWCATNTDLMADDWKVSL